MKQIFCILLLFFNIFINVSLSALRPDAKQVKSEDDARLDKYAQNYEKSTEKLHERTKRYVNQPKKWSRSSLKYSLRSYPTQINEAKTATIIHEAFKAWVDYIPLKIKATCSTCDADFVIEFKSKDPSDEHPFDGIGGTLAHAFYPEDGRVHFDKDEAWTESFNGTGTNLYLVAVHNIGHALGLEHTVDEESIMYPVYQLMPKSKILPQPDRVAIQSLYGAKQSSFGTTTTSTKKRRKLVTTTKNSITIPSGSSHSRCRLFLDGAFKHPDGRLHTFNAGILWRYLPHKNMWEGQASSFKSTYPNLPDRLRGVAYNSKTKEIVFFTDNYVYQYDIDHENLVKYRSKEPLATNLRNSIVGAIYYHNEIYIITEKTIQVFQLNNGQQQSREQNLSEKFPRFTGKVKSAFSYGDLHHFFTTDGLVYVWSERLNTWQTFGKPMERNWFACSGTDITKDIQTKQSGRKPTY